MRRSLLTLLLPAAALALASCADTIETAIPIEEHRMVVIPMRGPDGYYFDSRDGAGLAQAVTERLAAKRGELGKGDAMDVVAFEDLIAALQKRPQLPKDIPPQDLGRAVGADLVLLGDITQLQSHIPGDVGFARGRASVDIRVMEVAKPDRSLLKRTIKVTYPPENRISSTGIGSGEDDVRVGLMAALTDEISKLFYVHEKDKH